MPEAVPLRPGISVDQPRSVALLEHVTKCLADFEAKRPDEPASGIVFMIVGKDGSVSPHWLVADYWRQVLSHASVVFAAEAMVPR